MKERNCSNKDCININNILVNIMSFYKYMCQNIYIYIAIEPNEYEKYII